MTKWLTSYTLEQLLRVRSSQSRKSDKRFFVQKGFDDKCVT